MLKIPIDPNSKKALWLVRSAAITLILLCIITGAIFYLNYQYKNDMRELLETSAKLDFHIRADRRRAEQRFSIKTPKQDEWYTFYSAQSEKDEDVSNLVSLPHEKELANKYNEVVEHRAKQTMEVFTAIQEEFAMSQTPQEEIKEYQVKITAAATALKTNIQKYPGKSKNKDTSLYAIRLAIQSHQDALKNMQDEQKDGRHQYTTYDRLTHWRIAMYAGKKALNRINEGL